MEDNKGRDGFDGFGKYLEKIIYRRIIFDRVVIFVPLCLFSYL